MTALRIIPFFLLANCFFLACSFAPKPSLPEPVANIPERFVGSSATGAYEPLEWWRAFADPALDTIVEAVLASTSTWQSRSPGSSKPAREPVCPGSDFFPDVKATGAIDDVDLSVDAGIGAYIQEFGPDGAQEDFGQAFELPDRLALTLYSLSATLPTSSTSGVACAMTRAPREPSTKPRSRTCAQRASAFWPRRSRPTSRSPTCAGEPRLPVRRWMSSGSARNWPRPATPAD